MAEALHYVFEHTECLRERSNFQPGGGGFAIIAQRPVQLIGPRGHVQCLTPGTTLFNLLSDDLERALNNLLYGTALSSAARFGVSWVIAQRAERALQRGSLLVHDEARIDDWLDANTAVLHGALPHSLRPDVEAGHFNNLHLTWRAGGLSE